MVMHIIEDIREEEAMSGKLKTTEYDQGPRVAKFTRLLVILG